MVSDLKMAYRSNNNLHSGYILQRVHNYFPDLKKRPFFPHSATTPIGLSLLFVEASRSQVQHIRQDSSGRVISPTQRPLPDNTQHSQGTDIHAPAGLEPAISSSEWPQNHVLDRTATGTRCNLPHAT